MSGKSGPTSPGAVGTAMAMTPTAAGAASSAATPTAAGDKEESSFAKWAKRSVTGGSDGREH
jgi:hypothetical protein